MLEIKLNSSEFLHQTLHCPKQVPQRGASQRNDQKNDERVGKAPGSNLGFVVVLSTTAMSVNKIK